MNKVNDIPNNLILNTVFQIPKATIHVIIQLCSNFLWRAKVIKISWFTVCENKQEGGLGLQYLDEIQLAMGTKRVWKVSNKEGIRAKIINAKYFKANYRESAVCVIKTR